MKKRIFALLLAAVMVLSLGMAAVETGKAAGDTAVQNADRAEKTPEETAGASEDANTADDADGTDDADTAEDTDADEADDDIASEDDADEAEDEVSAMSVSGQEGVPQAATAGKLKVNIQYDNGLDAATAGFKLTADGNEVKDGMEVDADPAGTSFLSATLGIEIHDDYTVREEEEVGPIRWSSDGLIVTLNDRSNGGDGVVTIRVMKRAAVKVSFSQSGCTIKEVRDPRSQAPKPYNSGEPVYADQTIIVTVPLDCGVINSLQYDAHQEGVDWVVSFLQDHLHDGDDVPIQVEKLKNVKIEVTGDAGKLTYLALQGKPLTSGDTILIGEKGVLQAELQPGFWIESSDEVNSQTSRNIEVCDKDGNGTITLNVAARPAVTVEFKCPAGVSFDPTTVMVIDEWASGRPQPFTNPVYRGMVLIVTPPAGHCVVKEPGQDYFVREPGPGGTEYEVVLTTENLSGGSTTVEVTIQKVTTPAMPTPAPTPVPTPNVSASAAGTANDGQAKKQLEDTVGGMIKDAAAGKPLTGLDEEAAAAVEEAVKGAAEGNKVDISTELTVAKTESVPQEDETLVKGVLREGEEVAEYLDINIAVKVNGAESGHVTETDAPIDFAVDLPQNAAGPIIYVVRVHDGKAEPLTTTVKDGKAYFSSDKFSTYAIVNSSDISNALVGAIPDQTYTGKAVTPAVTVTVQGPGGTVTLKEGTDYALSYKGNVDVGTATVIITGKAPYTGTKTVTFRIVKPAASGSGSGTGTSPQTGDETPIALYGAILALSAGALALTVARRKKTSR